MMGKVCQFDGRTGVGSIRFNSLIDLPFSFADVKGPVIIRRGDEVEFDVKEVEGQTVAFKVKLL
jgi:hypothetical protein